MKNGIKNRSPFGKSSSVVCFSWHCRIHMIRERAAAGEDERPVDTDCEGSVTKNLITVKNRDKTGSQFKMIIQEKPKTEKSKRILPLNQAAIKALEDLKTAPGFKPGGFVIHTKAGTPVSPRTFEQMLELMCRAVGIRKVGVHALRHTYATRLFEKRVDIKVISELLGHSSTEITYKIYIHVIDSLKEAAVEAIELD